MGARVRHLFGLQARNQCRPAIRKSLRKEGRRCTSLMLSLCTLNYTAKDLVTYLKNRPCNQLALALLVPCTYTGGPLYNYVIKYKSLLVVDVVKLTVSLTGLILYNFMNFYTILYTFCFFNQQHGVPDGSVRDHYMYLMPSTL